MLLRIRMTRRKSKPKKNNLFKRWSRKQTRKKRPKNLRKIKRKSLRIRSRKKMRIMRLRRVRKTDE